jgi:predicted secreted protein
VFSAPSVRSGDHRARLCCAHRIDIRGEPSMLRTAIALLAALSVAAAHAAASEPTPRYDQVRLSASVAKQIDTDTLIAVLYKEHQSEDQATAANEVNRAVSWGIDEARKAEVELHTSSYRTQPVYQKQHIRGWRVYQSIRLEARDAQRLSALLGKLQERLSIQSLHNVLSDEARKAAEDALVADALDAFQQRATLIATTLGRDGHRIVMLDLNSSGGHPPPQPMMRSAMADSAAPVAPPSIEAGTAQVEVHVNGTIELNPAK